MSVPTHPSQKGPLPTLDATETFSSQPELDATDSADHTHTMNNSNEFTARNLFMEIPLGGDEPKDRTETQTGIRVICPKCYYNQIKAERCARCGKVLLGRWSAETQEIPDHLRPTATRPTAPQAPSRRRMEAAQPPPMRRGTKHNASAENTSRSLLWSFFRAYLILGICAGNLIALSYAVRFLFPSGTHLLPFALSGETLGLVNLHTMICVVLWFRKGR